MVQKWTKENIINVAKKYTTKTDFKKYGKGAYYAAHKFNLFNEFYWFINGRNKKRKWCNKDIVIAESKKYANRSEFRAKSHRAYETAKNNKWLDEMDWLNAKNVYTDKVDTVYKYYFKEQNAIYIGRTIDIKLRDYQHKTVINDTVYKFAKENNIIIPNIEIIETNLTILEGSKREKYWEEYYRNNGFNMLNKTICGSIGGMAKNKWSKSKCFQESKKYKSRGEFFIKNSNAYQKSLKKGWLDEMTWLTNTHRHKRGYWLNNDNIINEEKTIKQVIGESKKTYEQEKGEQEKQFEDDIIKAIELSLKDVNNIQNKAKTSISEVKRKIQNNSKLVSKSSKTLPSLSKSKNTIKTLKKYFQENRYGKRRLSLTIKNSKLIKYKNLNKDKTLTHVKNNKIFKNFSNQE